MEENQNPYTGWVRWEPSADGRIPTTNNHQDNVSVEYRDGVKDIGGHLVSIFNWGLRPTATRSEIVAYRVVKQCYAPTPAEREMLLPADPKERKALPITTGVLDYFPLALAYISKISKQGNDQHNPGQPLHWDKTKSKDHADCIARHLIDRGTLDTSDSPPLRHSGKLAWRALALLETELGNGTEP